VTLMVASELARITATQQHSNTAPQPYTDTQIPYMRPTVKVTVQHVRKTLAPV